MVADEPRRNGVRIIRTILLAAVFILSSVLGAMAETHRDTKQTGSVAFPLFGAVPLPTPNCTAKDYRVSDPGAVHGVFVLNPPVRPSDRLYSATVKYIRNNSAICGADFNVHWNKVDKGILSASYNWSAIDQEIQPWSQAGKYVNLIFQAVGYQPNQTYVPTYVLSHVPTIQCGGSSITPLYWNSTYVHAYRSFIRAAVHHFQTNPSIGYLRFGLGTGGETFPVVDITAPTCEARLIAKGFTLAIWSAYLHSMLVFEHSLNSTVQLMVALNNVWPGVGGNLSGTIAGWAVQNQIGFGTESLIKRNAIFSSSGAAVCHRGWCVFFKQYHGQVPLELQTQSVSDPSGSGPIGSLPPLLRWALGEHTQILEVYLADCMTAFDPGSPLYATYHTAYAASLESASDLLGESA